MSKKIWLTTLFVSALSISLLLKIPVLNSLPSASAFPVFWWQSDPPPPLGTRGDKRILCPIAPGLLDKKATIITSQPLFTWQGEAVKLIVRDYKTKAEVWQTDLDPTQQQVKYQGPSLQLNHLYQWQLLGASEKNVTEWHSFSVMQSSQRDQHLAQLKRFENPAQSQEAIAQAKAAYLKQPHLRLWSDAIQIISEVSNPSPSLVESHQAFMAHVCKTLEKKTP